VLVVVVGLVWLEPRRRRCSHWPATAVPWPAGGEEKGSGPSGGRKKARQRACAWAELGQEKERGVGWAARSGWAEQGEEGGNRPVVKFCFSFSKMLNSNIFYFFVIFVEFQK
jgi:hypothetical protein